MNPQEIDLIKVVLLDAIKILGPAVIAAYATYKATAVQFQTRLAEAEAKHGFGARERLFDYYKSRQEKLAESQKGLNHTFGLILGVAHSGGGEDNAYAPMLSLATLALNMAPFEIDTTLRDMKQKGLADSDEYQRLVSLKEKVEGLSKDETVENVKANIFPLLEAYSFLEACNQLLLERQMEDLFSVYMRRA